MCDAVAVAFAFDDDGVAFDDTKPVVVVIVVCIGAGGWTKVRTVSHPSKACVPSLEVVVAALCLLRRSFH